MSDFAAFASAVTSLKAASDIAKALIGLRDTSAIQTKVIELQGEILAAQSSALAAQAEQSALLESKRQLEKEVADLKAWDAEKQKYKLVNISAHFDGAAFVYTLKEDAGSPEPRHYLCANCFEDGRKAILQAEVRSPGRVTIFSCLRCGAEVNKTGVSYASTPRANQRTRTR